MNIIDALKRIPGRKGPGVKFLGGIATYRVHYRYRLPNTATWDENEIHMTARTEADCRQRCIQFLSQRWRAEVEIFSVKLVSEEMALQTGEPVEVVSEDEYEKQKEKTVDETKEGLDERKAKLREGGLWIPE